MQNQKRCNGYVDTVAGLSLVRKHGRGKACVGCGWRLGYRVGRRKILLLPIVHLDLGLGAREVGKIATELGKEEKHCKWAVLLALKRYNIHVHMARELEGCFTSNTTHNLPFVSGAAFYSTVELFGARYNPITSFAF